MPPTRTVPCRELFLPEHWSLVKDRLSDWSHFAPSNRVPFPSWKTGDPCDDLAAVLCNRIPLCVVYPSEDMAFLALLHAVEERSRCRMAVHWRPSTCPAPRCYRTHRVPVVLAGRQPRVDITIDILARADALFPSRVPDSKYDRGEHRPDPVAHWAALASEFRWPEIFGRQLPTTISFSQTRNAITLLAPVACSPSCSFNGGVGAAGSYPSASVPAAKS